MDQIKIDSRRIALLRLDGTIIEVNKTALEIGRLTLGEVKDQKFWNAYWWHITPHMKQELQAAIQRSAEGEPVRYEMPAHDTEGDRVIIDLSIKPIRLTLNRSSSGGIARRFSAASPSGRIALIPESTRPADCGAVLPCLASGIAPDARTCSGSSRATARAEKLVARTTPGTAHSAVSRSNVAR